MSRIAFRYHGRHRLLDDTTVKFTKDFHLIITGRDADSGKTRTFRVDRIDGPVKEIPRARIPK